MSFLRLPYAVGYFSCLEMGYGVGYKSTSRGESSEPLILHHLPVRGFPCEDVIGRPRRLPSLFFPPPLRYSSCHITPRKSRPDPPQPLFWKLCLFGGHHRQLVPHPHQILLTLEPFLPLSVAKLRSIAWQTRNSHGSLILHRRSQDNTFFK